MPNTPHVTTTNVTTVIKKSLLDMGRWRCMEGAQKLAKRKLGGPVVIASIETGVEKLKDGYNYDVVRVTWALPPAPRR